MNIDFNTVLSWLLPLIISLLTTLCAYAFTFGKRSTQIDNLLSDVKELKDNLKEMTKDLTIVQTQIDFVLPSKKSSFAKAHSPISLTEEGEKVRLNIKADDILKNHKTELYKLLPDNLNNAYDIQMAAFRIINNKLFSLLTDKELLSLKNEVYLLGKPLEDLLIIFQILFRDDILKTKNIPIAEVDKHDPSKKL